MPYKTKPTEEIRYKPFIAFPLAIILLVFLVSCGIANQTETSHTPTPEKNITPTLTLTPASTPTNTPSPTPSSTPSPTATPFAGGGKILIVLAKRNYPAQVSLQGEQNLFIAEPDGTEIKPITDLKTIKDQFLVIEGVSPNHHFVAINLWDLKNRTTSLNVLDVFSDELIPISNNVIPLDDAGGGHTVLWLPDGRLSFVARDTDGRYTIFVTGPRGDGLTRLTKPLSTGFKPRALLSTSVDGEGLYWIAGDPCSTRGLCGEKYYWTKIDDSDQQRVWKGIQAAGLDVYISPSGQYLSYSAYSGTFQDKYKDGCYVASLHGIDISNVVQLKVNDKPVDCYENTWSPNGSVLIVSRWDNGILSNYTYTPESNTTIRLPDDESCSYHVWIDDLHLLLSRCSQGPRLIDLSTQGVTVFPLGGSTDYLSISQDRTKVLFGSGGMTRGLYIPGLAFEMVDVTSNQVIPFLDSLVPEDFVWLDTP